MVGGTRRLAFTLTALALVGPQGCGNEGARTPTEAEVWAEIEAAGYCVSDDECVDVGPRCPFGCAIPVNRAEAGRIREVLESTPRTCIYLCGTAGVVSCEEGRCVPECDGRPGICP